MYYPVFRGKQFELLAIRETSELMAKSGIVPIIEPVKKSLAGLERALKSICDAGGEAIVVVNPHHGDYSADGSEIFSLLESKFLEDDDVKVGILLNQSVSVAQAAALYDEYEDYDPVLIHAGFAYPQELAAEIGEDVIKVQNVFFERHCGATYRKHFTGDKNVLIRDGFEVQNNADYPAVEIFSDLHLTYEDDGFSGFGDFLTVGDVFKEGGGPAYAVAIHVTFLDDDEEDVMYIYHFVSDTNGTPVDTAGKFGEALKKLVNRIQKY